jgi:hypothetical protein
MMEVVSTSEMSVNFYQTTWCNILEDDIFKVTEVCKIAENAFVY